MKKLPWKIVALQDESASWLEAYIPHLKWTYVIEAARTEGYSCSFYPNNHCSDSTPLHKTPLKNLRNAKEACLNHLIATSQRIEKYLNTPTPEDETNLGPTELSPESLFEDLEKNLPNSKNPSNPTLALFA